MALALTQIKGMSIMCLINIIMRPAGICLLVVTMILSAGEFVTSSGLDLSLRSNTGKKSQFNTNPPPSNNSGPSRPTSSQPSGPSPEELKEKKLKKEGAEANIQGVKYFNSENWDTAIVYFEDAIRKDPNNTVARENLRNARTRKVHEQAIKANDIALEFSNNGDYESAIRYYKQALEHWPDSEVILENLRRDQNSKRLDEERARRREQERREEEARSEEFRLKDIKTKEAKQNVTNMLNDMASEFDVSVPSAAPGSSGLVIMGLSASGKTGESSASSGLSLMKPSIRIFDKGTRHSAPVDVRSLDADSSKDLRDASASTSGNNKLKQQAFEQIDRQFEEIEQQFTQAMAAEFLALEVVEDRKEALRQFDQVMGETFKGMRERMLAHIEERYKDEPGQKEQKLKETERYFGDLRKQSAQTMADEWQEQQVQEKQREADRQFSKVMGSTFEEMRQQKLAQIEEQYKDDATVKKRKLEEMESDLKNLEEQFSKKMADGWLRQQAQRRKADAMQMSKRVIDEAIKDARQHERRQVEEKYREAGTKVASEKVSEKSGIETKPLDVSKIDTAPRVLNIKGEGETLQPEGRKWPGAQNPEPPLLNPLWTAEEKKTKIQDWAGGRSEWPSKWPSDWTYEEREAAIDVFIRNGAERRE